MVADLGVGRFEFSLRLHERKPYRLHRHSLCLRRYVLVVERSPRLPDRGFAADCPIFSVFKPSRVPFPVPLWWKSSQEIPAIHPVVALTRYQVRRPVTTFTLRVVKLPEEPVVLELTLLALIELRCCS